MRTYIEIKFNNEKGIQELFINIDKISLHTNNHSFSNKLEYWVSDSSGWAAEISEETYIKIKKLISETNEIYHA